MKRYSCFLSLMLLAGARSHAADAAQVLLEDFSTTFSPSPAASPEVMKGPAPSRWESGNEKKGVRDYVVVSENGEQFLKARYLNDTRGTTVYRKIEWDVLEFPIISWRWRIHAFPQGAKIQDSGKRDAAASIYVTIKYGFRAYVLKYIWATDDAIGSTYESGRWNPTGILTGIVIRSGGKVGEWVSETRNVVQDFEQYFKKKSEDIRGNGIGVMSDGDQTKSPVEADYDDIIAHPADFKLKVSTGL